MRSAMRCRNVIGIARNRNVMGSTVGVAIAAKAKMPTMIHGRARDSCAPLTKPIRLSTTTTTGNTTTTGGNTADGNAAAGGNAADGNAVQ